MTPRPTRSRPRARLLPLIALFGLGLPLLPPAAAEEGIPPERVRAINMARTHAVRINGGLDAYRPAQCMFATAASDNPCLVRDDADGILFRFAGGPPAWEQKDLAPTLETEILIAPDGRSVLRLIHNGPPR